MNLCLLIVFVSMNQISGKYLLIEVNGPQNKTFKSSDNVPYECPGKMVLSPYDNCNQCTCSDDGGCMKIGTCTKIGCPGTKQKTGQLCSVALNNCADPTICTNDTRVLSIDICTKDVGKYVFKNFVP